jgi:hypothetical protein
MRVACNAACAIQRNSDQIDAPEPLLKLRIAANELLAKLYQSRGLGGADRFFGTPVRLATPRSDFDEDNALSVIGNQIDLSGLTTPFPIEDSPAVVFQPPLGVALSGVAQIKSGPRHSLRLSLLIVSGIGNWLTGLKLSR